ncbi:MAG: rhodanese-like domain-containing protein [Cyanobacteria bacterium J06649_5]
MLLRLSALTALVLLLLVAFKTVSGDHRTLPLAGVERSGIEQASIESASIEQASTEQAAIAASAPVSDAINFEQQWVVSAPKAKQLIDQGATLLDARGTRLGRRTLPGARAVSWKTFSAQAPASARGNLLADDNTLTQKLRDLGISADTPVVVFANPPSGWGEDGRIVWMLRTLGHRQAVMVDGGHNALINAGVSPQRTDSDRSAERGDFVINRDPRWDIQQDSLQQQLGADNLVVIDTRQAREFSGATPYGEQRGGHIPGAVHLHFKDLLAEDGLLRSPTDIRERLQALGITPDTQIVTYCTGGIRSGWLTAVLTTLGFSVQNYAGSMWEWSAGEPAEYPLEF